MDIAALCYFPDKDNIVPSRSVTLAQGDLRAINHWTSYFENEKQFLEHPVYASKVKEFLKANGILVPKKPLVGIMYVKDEKTTEILHPLFEAEPIRVRNDLSQNTFSEAEKARKLLLNSKNQKFAEMVLRSKRLEPTLQYRIQITYEEAKMAKKFGLTVMEENGEYSTTIREMLRYRVLKYRSKEPSLGYLRRLTEDACELWKDKIIELNGTNNSLGYYYQMYLRQLMHKYDELKFKEPVVKGLTVSSENVSFLPAGYSVISTTQALSIAAVPKHKSFTEGSNRPTDSQAA